MRANEILLELREYMDRGKYGCWVDAKTNKIYSVDKYQHVNKMKIYLMKNHGATVDDFATMREKTIYELGFADHMVRVSFGNRVDINIEGVSKDLQKVSQILLATCVQPDVNDVYVDKRVSAAKDSGGAKLFEMPADRRRLMMFLKNEVE